MNRNIETLIKACDELGIGYIAHHSTENLLSVKAGPTNHLFVNWTTPLNPQSIVELCKDKDYFYTFFANTTRIPKTISFLNPYCDEKYEKYLNKKTIFDIIEQTEAEITYPLIVKKNRGSWGTNVFKVIDRRGLEKSLLDVFNMNSADFDYVCLVQEYIDIKEEFRAIFLQGKHMFCYKKVINKATFDGNLSPLHWKGAYAEIVTDRTFLARLEQFCLPMFKKLNIPFCGLDIALDKQGRLYLIEANSSPGFEHIIENGGEAQVIDLYKSMLAAMIKNEANRAV